MARHSKRFAFFTGPTTVDAVAGRLSGAGFRDVFAGTERVYFRMSPAWEQAADEVLVYEAQRQVDEVYPHAGFRVYEA